MPTSSRRSLTGLVGLALAGLLFAAVLPSTAQKEGYEEPPLKQGLVVTYLIYSGMPNPTVTLTDPAQIGDIQERIANVQAAGTRIDGEGPESILGYNGIMIEDWASQENEDATFYVIKNDVLSVDGGNPEDPSARSVTIASDAAEIENLLIALGVEAGAIDEATLAEIRNPK